MGIIFADIQILNLTAKFTVVNFSLITGTYNTVVFYIYIRILNT